jgi:hypothetical protein
MVARKESGKKLCRICRKPLPEKSRNGNQILCINPPDMKDEAGRAVLTKCQVINRRRAAARARGYGELDDVQCEICFEFFTPDHPAQKVHKSKTKGEMSTCEVERQRRYSERYRGAGTEKSGYRLDDNYDMPAEDRQERVCLGRICTDQSNYPGELKFLSTGPGNRQCRRCKDAEEMGGRSVTNTEPGRLSKEAALIDS